MLRGWLAWIGIIAVSTVSLATNQTQLDPSSTIWFDKPAANWDEALPVGNGRLGGMVFGTVNEERIQLNEETFWSGGPYSTVVKDGYKALPEIQRLVFQEKLLEAHNLFGRNLMGYPVEQQKYQSFANLHLFFAYVQEPTNYRRALDLNTSLATVEYQVGDTKFQRQVIASAPDNVIAVHLTADQTGQVSFRANLRGVRNTAHSNYGTGYFRMDPVGQDGLAVTGRSTDYLGIPGQMKYEGRIWATTEGGTVRTDGVDLIVENADSATLWFVAATNFVNYKDVSADPHARVEQDLAALKTKSFASLKTAAVADYKTFFDRASLTLPTTASSSLPTNDRRAQGETNPDPSLAALAYNFGRYVLISSSRPGTQPANLQGIWNNDMNPSWDSKYTTNINTEMNYWLANPANLPELNQPLFKMIAELTDQGSQVAREHYGAKGWVFHQNTDQWRVAAPMDGPTWGTFTTGGAWLSTHLWEHYEYTQNKDFLAEVFPILEGSIEFFLDFLVPHPNGKWLVTNPSTSPENFPDGGSNKPYYDEVVAFMLPGTSICAGSSIDMQILHDLFGYYLEASEILGKDTDLQAHVKDARSKLVPPQIGADGSLQEWAEDWTSLEKNHRHFSHLYGFYPGRVLWDKRTPELIEAIKQVLEERGDGGMGFSMAWKMALWARLGDGNRANKIFKGYIANQSCAQMFALCGRALQVDGTLGMTAAINEMLVQSHDDHIKLLPALPAEWSEGTLQGVCTRGGFELSFTWKNGQVTQAQVTSIAGQPCKINAGKPFKVHQNTTPVETTTDENGTQSFPTTQGATYDLIF